MEDLKTYIKQISPVTRYFLGSTLLLSFCMTYKIISPYSLFLTFPQVFYDGHVWRLITTFLYAGPFSMGFIFTMMMMYYTFSSIEKHFENRQAELGTLLLFNACTSLLFGWLADDYMVMQSPYAFSVMYVWSKLEPDLPMSIWGFPIKSVNLPWVMMAFHLFTGGNPFSDLIGVAAGHTYIYLKVVLPDSHGYNLLKTPGWMDKLVAKLNAWHEDPRAARGGRIYNLNNDGAQANPAANEQRLNRNE